MPKIGLGRGLSALIPTQGEKEEEEIPEGADVSEMPVLKIKPNPNQPRKDIDPEKLAELANSIKEHGILQPLIIDKEGMLIVGQRRLEAAKLAGLKKVPVIIRVGTEGEKLEMSMIENVQREDLNPIEKAEAYRVLISKFGLSQEELSRRLGKGRSTITNSLRFLNLPLEIQQGLKEGEISENHAKAILSLDNPEKQLSFYKKIIEENLTVPQSWGMANKIAVVKKHKRRLAPLPPLLAEAEEKLRETLGTRIRVTRDGGVGKILIEFYSDEELAGILEKIAKI